MYQSTLHKLIAFNEQYGLFSQDACLLVAASGGADSTALVSLLAALKELGQVRDLICVHFNHQLRDQAEQDQTFVQRLSAKWSIPCIMETRDIRSLAQILHCSIETAGRQWRLERLVCLAKEHHCTAVATGHHLDDNAETLIHRLSRGTGYRGLCGIRPIRLHQDVRFISPLMVLTRQGILTYLAKADQTWCEDASNQDQKYTRNRIRHTVLPDLSRQCPALTDALGELSLTCQRLYAQKIEPHVETLINTHVAFFTERATVQLQGLTQEPSLVLVELVRRILTHLHIPLRPVTQYHYETILKILDKQETYLNLPGNLTVTQEQELVRFYPTENKQNAPQGPVELTVPGITRFGHWCLKTRLLDVSHIDAVVQSNPYIEHFDLKKIAHPLYIRNRIPGDRFTPLGKHTPQKVGKFLSRANSQALDQNDALILYDDKETILWVCPVRMSDGAKLTKETKNVLEVSVRIDPEI